MGRVSKKKASRKSSERENHHTVDPAFPLEKPEPFKTSDHKGRTHIALILGTAFALRFVFFYLNLRNNPAFNFPIMDSLYHHEWAKSIISGKFWGDEVYFRGPLYAYSLALLYKLSGSSISFAVLCQHLIGGLTCGLIYLLSREYFTRRVSFLAGILAALYWPFIYFEGELLIVTSVLFLNTLTLLLLSRSIKKDNLRHLIATGAVLGLSAIARPNVLSFAPAIPIAYYATRRVKGVARHHPGRGWLLRSVIVLAACFIVILPVTVRNYVVGGAIVPIASSGGVNFYIGNNPASNGRTAIVPGTRAPWWGGNKEAIAIAEREDGRKLGPVGASNYYFRRGLEFILSQPGDAGSLLLKKLIIFWEGAERSNDKLIYFFWHLAGMRWIPLPGFWFIAPLALLGAFLQYRRRWVLSPLYLFTATYMLGVVVFFVNARLRLPVVPILIILAAFSIHYLIEAYRVNRLKLLTSSLGLAVAALAVNHGYLSFYKSRVYHLAISHYTLGSAYLQMGRRDNAIAEYELARQKYEQYPTTTYQFVAQDIYSKLGALYWEQGRCLETIEVLKGIRINDERTLAARGLLADCYSKTKQPGRAIRIFKEVLRIRPGHAPWVKGLAQAYAATGNLERAESILKSLLERPSQVDIPAYLSLARIQQELGKLDAAIESYSEVLRFPGYEREALLAISDVYKEKGDSERALQALEEARAYSHPSDESVEKRIDALRDQH